LQSHRYYPSVSILAPTHRTAPRNRQDPIKVKNLVRKAIGRLHGEFKKREVAAVVKNLQDLVRNVDWKHTLEGLALFASENKSAAVGLPFRVRPRAMIDETFATRDLVYSFNRAQPYRVLVLGHQARLFDAWTAVLDEHTARPFPMLHGAPAAGQSSPAARALTARRCGMTPSGNFSGRSMVRSRPWRRPTPFPSSSWGWNATWHSIRR
jgi:hypothetical protein